MVGGTLSGAFLQRMGALPHRMMKQGALPSQLNLAKYIVQATVRIAASEDASSAQLQQLLWAMLASHSGQPVAMDAVLSHEIAKVVDAMRKNQYRDSFSLSDMAALSRMPVETFRKRFVSEVGMPPQSYQLFCKMERAKQLLKEGGVVKDDIWYPSEASLKGAEKCLMFNNPMGLTTDQEWTEVQQWLRPVLLSLISCNKVLIEGVTFRNSPAWCLHPLMCENVILDGVKVFNPWYSQNGDALDLESCNKVLIQNCLFDAGDDAICIKSGKDRDGRERGIPCQNVYIRDNVVLHGHGGFVVGSEMSGGVRNLLIEDCTFLGTDVGLRFKSTRGRGGVVEDIHIKGINMIDIAHEAIIMDLYYAGKASGEGDENNPTENTIPEVTEETPAFRNITMDNIVCNGAKIAVKINGLPEMPVENVTISNAIFNNCKQEAEINRGKNIVMENVVINEKTFSYNH